ncbi:MAG: alanine racemase, partial [Betaproteobacteria bacterium]
MARPTQVTVSLSAFRHNLGRARQLAPNSKVWAVVKADAYGHGLMMLAPALAEADGLALVEFEWAQQLREFGWDRPILMLEGAFDYADVQAAAADGLELVVHEAKQIEWIERFGGAARLRVHLKLNTGMNRLGFHPAGFRDAWRRLRSLSQVSSITLMTHFAN